MYRNIIIAKVLEKLCKSKRKIIISKVLKKLAKKILTPEILNTTVNDLKKIYQKHKDKDFEDNSLPKEVLKYIGNFMDNYTLDQKEKLFILKETKRNKLFDFTLNKNLEKAWRLILKKWNLSSYRLEGGL